MLCIKISCICNKIILRQIFKKKQLTTFSTNPSSNPNNRTDRILNFVRVRYQTLFYSHICSFNVASSNSSKSVSSYRPAIQFVLISVKVCGCYNLLEKKKKKLFFVAIIVEKAKLECLSFLFFFFLNYNFKRSMMLIVAFTR